MSRHICIVYTGGTVGMRRSGGRWQSCPGFLAEQMAQMPELGAEGMPSYDVHEFEQLHDSANMQPRDWIEIAAQIDRRYFDGYDAFVVLHGTDTLAYTSSALAMFFATLDKPVVVTGSQVPLCMPRNDARENIVTALQIAGDPKAPREVCVYFNDLLLRGCRTTKMDCDGFGAFATPNVEPLGRIGIYFEYRVSFAEHLFRTRRPHDEERVPPGHAISSRPVDPLPQINLLKLHPGISVDVLRAAVEPPAQGLVLECFGIGNGPAHHREFLVTLSRAAERMAIVAVTQCPSGSVWPGQYATGAALADAGVLPGADMTTEAALAKLFYLFHLGLPLDEIRRIVPYDLRGELSGPDYAPPAGSKRLQEVLGTPVA